MKISEAHFPSLSLGYVRILWCDVKQMWNKDNDNALTDFSLIEHEFSFKILLPQNWQAITLVFLKDCLSTKSLDQEVNPAATAWSAILN